MQFRAGIREIRRPVPATADGISEAAMWIVTWHMATPGIALQLQNTGHSFALTLPIPVPVGGSL